MDVQGFDEKYIPQEELSPTTEEYQECCAPDDDYQYDIATVGEMLAAGCVAPSPTPAPSIAPLAEVEVDPPDDEVEMLEQQSGTAMIPTTVAVVAAEKQDSVEHKRKRKKKNSFEMKTDKDLETGDAIVALATTTVVTTSDDPHNRNAVCPWEDE